MKHYLNKLIQKQDLTSDEITEIGELLATGQLEPVQAAAFLMGLAMKGETVEEIVGLVQTMRRHMIPALGLEEALDTCGTGGDGAETLNASTMSALVCAAAGVPVAKHGNRAVSSKCGSFDLLEKLGVNINVSAGEASNHFKTMGITFLFAPNFHPAFKHITPIRRSLGIRTIFNFLGPLLNPGRVRYQVIGTSSTVMAPKLGASAIMLGSKKVLVVYSEDGLDEASPAAPTHVLEYTADKEPKEWLIKPEHLWSLDLVRGGSPEENTTRTLAILSGKGSQAENEFVALNAGLGLYAYGKTPSFAEGKKLAQEILASGAAMQKITELATTKILT